MKNTSQWRKINETAKNHINVQERCFHTLLSLLIWCYWPSSTVTPRIKSDQKGCFFFFCHPTTTIAIYIVCLSLHYCCIPNTSRWRMTPTISAWHTVPDWKVASTKFWRKEHTSRPGDNWWLGTKRHPFYIPPFLRCKRNSSLQKKKRPLSEWLRLVNERFPANHLLLRHKFERKGKQFFILKKLGSQEECFVAIHFACCSSNIAPSGRSRW